VHTSSYFLVGGKPNGVCRDGMLGRGLAGAILRWRAKAA